MKKVIEGEVVPEGFSFKRHKWTGSKNEHLSLMATFCYLRFCVRIENGKKYVMELRAKNSFGNAEALIAPKKLSKREFNLIVKSFREFVEFVDNGFKING